MKRVSGIIAILFYLLAGNGNAQSCSGSYTTTSATCQQFTVGNGTSGSIVLCINTNNIPGGGGSSCNPGGSCNPPYGGGGWSPRIAIYNTSGTLLTTWTSVTAAGTCYTLSTTNGYAVIYGLCLAAGTTISWNTINKCGTSVCSAPPPCAGQPCASCTAACPACGYTTTPSVGTVTSTCPGQTLAVPFGSGQNYTMCATFTAAATTVTFNAIIQSNCGSGNVSNFGWTLQNSSCGGILQSGTLSNLTFTNLIIGSVYTFCYWFQVPVSPYCQHTIHWPYFVGAVPLPVELVNFSTHGADGRVIVKWTTATERNSRHFEVERSGNAQDYEQIGVVMSGNNSTGALHYEFTDEKPLVGISYYRLKLVDIDGSYKYSGIETSNHTQLFKNDFALVPNPATNEVHVNFVCNSSSTEMIHIYGHKGEHLLTQEVNCVSGSNTARLNVSGLNAGLYYVIMNTSDKTFRSKLVIQ